MHCPRCSTPMGDFRTEQGVVVDYCSKCSAAWFDAGELAAMLGVRDDLSFLDAVSNDAAESTLGCPRCPGSLLSEMPYAPGSPTRVSTCALCGGVLSSLPDLSRLREAAVMAPRASSASSTGLARLAGGDGNLDATARRFKGLTGLEVKQRRRFLEMLTGWETPNEYTVLRRGAGGAAFHVVEQTAGWAELLRRLFLGPARPFTAHVEDLSRGTLALRLVRPWRWFFPELAVLDADERPLLTIRKRWSWVRALYDVDDARGNTIGQVCGAFWRPWTFELRGDGRLMATVRKRWSGLVTEALSDADNFTVEFDPSTPDRWKLAALAAAVLIDVVHFERSDR